MGSIDHTASIKALVLSIAVGRYNNSRVGCLRGLGRNVYELFYGILMLWFWIFNPMLVNMAIIVGNNFSMSSTYGLHMIKKMKQSSVRDGCKEYSPVV